MVIYWSVFVILAIMAYAEKFISSFYKYKKSCLIFCFFLFFFISAFRWETGTDWEPYYNFFLATNTDFSEWNGTFEIGYTFLNKIVKVFFDNYTVFLAVLAFLVLTLNFSSIYKFDNYSNNYQLLQQSVSSELFFILLAFWSMYLGSIFIARRSISNAICLFSLIYCYKKKPLHFILCIFIATLMHRSAIFFLLSYFIFNLNFDKKKLFFTTIVLICFGMFCAKFIFLFFAKVFSQTSLGEKFLWYYNEGASSQYGSIYSTTFSFIKGTANTILLLAIVFWTYKRNKSNRAYRGLANIFCFGSILFISLIRINTTLAAISVMFMQAQILLLPALFKSCSIREHKLLFILFIIYLGLRFYLNLHTYGDGVYIPYITIFDRK